MAKILTTFPGLVYTLSCHAFCSDANKRVIVDLTVLRGPSCNARDNQVDGLAAGSRYAERPSTHRLPDGNGKYSSA